ARRLHGDRRAVGCEERHRQAEEYVEPEPPRDRHPGPTRQLGIDRRLLGSHLHRTDGSERDHANRLAQEARASATGLDEDDLQVGAKAPEHDSRETRAAVVTKRASTGVMAANPRGRAADATSAQLAPGFGWKGLRIRSAGRMITFR